MANQSEPVIADLIGVTQIKNDMPHLGLFTANSKGELTATGSPIDIGTATNIYTGFFCDTGYVNLLVQTSEGQARFYSVGLDNTLTQIGKDPLFIEWVSVICAGQFQQDAPYTDIVIVHEGKVQFYASDGKGGLTPLKSNAEIPRYASLKPGKFDLSSELTDFFMYASGSLQFFKTDGEGNLTALGKEKKCGYLSDFVVGNFGVETEGDDLLLIKQETNEARFFSTTGDGNLQPIGDVFDGSGFSGSTLIAGPFAGGDSFDSIMACDQSGGIRFFSTDGKGGIQQIGEKIEQYSVAEFTPIKIVR